ncbi:hypothetical protein [Polaribacter sp. MED152]|uniref:hypothetical protein n=1 Tax=Polaribacter sp. MED152 TaxID=313598 RepID=UPI000068C9E2|nr:hypothetical protein [Polaribacter sp. MED152]EAQ42449.1 hypothetical protein MED152_07005 [Polaribacter sp. MED152]
MKKTTILIATFILLVSSYSFGQDEDNGWVLLSTKKVSYKAETDKVNMLTKVKNLSKIKLKCTQGTFKLKQIRVEMSDGTKKEFKPKGLGVLTKGTSSFTYDLPGDDLKLKALEIDYGSYGSMLITKRGIVEIWGKKRNEK